MLAPLDRLVIAAVLSVTLSGCGDWRVDPDESQAADDVGGDDDPAPLTCDESVLPYAREVVSYTPGAGAGFGQDDFPDVVLGPARASGPDAGAVDVLSLGVGGEIVLGFGERVIVDGPGADFVVFENAFRIGGDETKIWFELGEVAVSEDGVTWQAFACDSAATVMPYTGCAGWTPAQAFEACALVPLDAGMTGGDAFDLATVGVTRAQYVRVRDLATTGVAPSAGFDLDAVGLVHWE